MEFTKSDIQKYLDDVDVMGKNYCHELSTDELEALAKLAMKGLDK